MGGQKDRCVAAVAMLIAIALLGAAAAPAARAPIRPVKVRGSSETSAAVPCGKAKLLLLGFGKDGGSVTLVRLDGSIDRAFGDDDTVDIEANDAAVAPNGKILIVSTKSDGGSPGTMAQVTRLLPDGKIDRSFGRAGSFDVRFGRYGDGQTIALADDGDILLGGVRVDNPNSTYFTEADLGVARLRPNGALDRSFGHRGVSIIRSDDEIRAQDIAPTPDGGVVIEEGNSIDAYLEKLDRDGSPDRHFGHDGFVAIEGRRGEGGSPQLLLAAPGFAVLPGGKILVAARRLLSSGRIEGLVGRYRADGRIDRSWGREGWAAVPGGVHGFAPLPDGTLAVATTFSGPKARGGSDFGAVALDRDGRLDRDFATHGRCRAPLPGSEGVRGVFDVGGQAVVLGTRENATWMITCRSLP